MYLRCSNISISSVMFIVLLLKILKSKSYNTHGIYIFFFLNLRIVTGIMFEHQKSSASIYIHLYVYVVLYIQTCVQIYSCVHITFISISQREKYIIGIYYHLEAVDEIRVGCQLVTLVGCCHKCRIFGQ